MLLTIQNPSAMGPSSPEANGGEGGVWVRRMLTFIEQLPFVRLFIYVLSFNLQETIISTLYRKKEKLKLKQIRQFSQGHTTREW